MTGKSRRFAEVGFVVMWSSGFIGARLGTPEASTPTLMAWRFLLAAGLLLVGAFLLQRRLPDGCRRCSGVRSHCRPLGPRRGPPASPRCDACWSCVERARE